MRGGDWHGSLQQLHSSENPETQKLTANLSSLFKLNFAALLSAAVQDSPTLPKNCEWTAPCAEPVSGWSYRRIFAKLPQKLRTKNE